MRVGEVMTRGVEVVPADATVQEAARAMAERDVGAVLVGSEEAPLGILTDRDILMRAVVPGRDVTTLTAGEIMSSSLFTCAEGDDAAGLLPAMDERQIRRVPVLDGAGRAVGIVARSDITRAPPAPPGEARAAPARAPAAEPEPPPPPRAEGA